MSKMKKILGATIIGVVGLAAMGCVPAEKESVVCEPKIVKVNNTIVTTEVVEVEKIVEVPYNVTVEVEDTDRIDSFKLSLEDRGIIDDAEEIEEIIEEEDKAIEKALNLIDSDEKELFDMLEKEGIVIDEDEVEVIKVYSDFEDIVISTSDFDDKEYEFVFKVKIEDTDEELKKYVDVTVSIEDGEATIEKVEERV